MRRKIVFLLLNAVAILALAGWFSRTAFTQGARLDRIAGPVGDSPAVWLAGNRRPMFQPENDLGPVADSLKLENMTLSFKPTDEQQANLTALLAQQQDPSSPQYHQWITPEQFADNFGLTANDMAKVTDWLKSQGFTISQVARSRNWVSFNGTAAQVRSSLLTEIHNYSWRGKTYYANASEPAVPAVFADMVMGVTALDNYGLKPHSVFHQIVDTSDLTPGVSPAGSGLKPGATSDPVQPEFTSQYSGSNFLSPADFATIYDLNGLYSAGLDGTGQKIAVVGQTDLYGNGSDVTTFRSISGLPVNSPTYTLIPGASDPGVVTADLNEASLDVEWSGAVAPKAQIIFLNGGTNGVVNALNYAISQNVAPVITMSYGNCEANWGPTALQTLSGQLQQANSQGITLLAAAGDSGSADCDYSTTPSSPVLSATHGLAVDAPASLPYATGMGGTEFNEGTGSYWLTTTPTLGDLLSSAKSYIPEKVWNDTSGTLGLLSGGGGVSIYFPKPAWQTGTGVPTDSQRDVPDVSMNASVQHDGYLVCVQGKCINGFRDNSTPTPLLTVAGGTSAAAPTFAAIVALINQKYPTSTTTRGQGNINPTLYAMAASTPSAFHDVTVGNNSVPCTTGSTGCSSGGNIGYNAGVGYDLASGLGSVDAFNLVNSWTSSGAGNLPAPTLSLPAIGATGVALSPGFTWSAVSGNAGYRIMIATSPGSLPTNPATTTCSACTLVDTTATDTTSYTPSSALTAGTYYWQVQAIEPTSSSGTAAWSTVFSFTTTGGTLGTPTLSSPANGATGIANQPTFTWSAVTGNSGYRIFVATALANLPTSISAGSCVGCAVSGTATGESFTPATAVLSGGTTYYWEVQAVAPSGGVNGGWSTVFSFTTVPADFSLSASSTSVTVVHGSSATSTLTMTLTNNPATPTFTCSASSSLAGVTCSVGTFTGNTATVTINASSTAKVLPWFRYPRFGGWWLTGAAMLCLLMIALLKMRQGGVPVWRWNVSSLALGAALVVLLAAGVSCGGGSSSSGGGGGGGGGTAESGTVTITGTSGSTRHTATISVNVT